MQSHLKLSQVLALSAVSALFGSIDATSFLRSEPVGANDVEVSLAQELGSNVSQDRLNEFEAALRPTYNALPKNDRGYIDHQVVRYVLHRFFVQRSAWYINGLEPKGDTWQTHSVDDKATIQGWLPSLLQSKIDERFGGHGFNLHEVAAFAATLEDLVRIEASRRLEEVYEVMRLPVTAPISKESAEEAINTYLMIYLVGRNVSLSNPGQATKLRQLFAAKYKGWSEADKWLHKVEQHLINSTTTGDIDFGAVSQVIRELGEQFGSFNDLECQELKTMLIGMEGRKAGRISLPDFYNMSLYSHWKFIEKAEYLRDLGALDESDPTKPPLVIVPNYLSSAPNCLRATDLYQVCCPNECEPLLGHLEQQIGKFSAPPDQIATLVMSLSSPTVSAPRKLPPALRRRLQEIASHHGGEVNLHGRLFSQWMHHAFPRECPFPHEAGTTNPQTADEWMAASGKDSETSEDERRKIIDDACSANGEGAAAGEVGQIDDEEPELPWRHAEELLVLRPPSTKGWRLLQVLGFAVVLGAAVYVFMLDATPIQKDKWQPMLALCLLIVLAFALDLLDRAIFSFSLIGGVLFIGFRKLSPSLLPTPGKPGKCKQDFDDIWAMA